MHAILVAASKGGCGKTTLVTNLATALANAGRRTVVIDADPQRSAYRWCARRPDDLSGVLALEARGPAVMAKLPPDADALIIDTPAGTTARQLAPWLEHVSAMLVPALPSAFDFDATLDFLGALSALPAVAEGRLPVALVANRLRPRTVTSRNAITALKAQYFPLVAQLRDNQSYVFLAGLGKGLFDYHSETVRQHQDDWKPLLRWCQRHG
ncbi:ParA family protein [Oleiagrimonas sp. C23AA]|uniref:ParA family protein n=1 Tax=Oleiagrimonas sp. C23AA TaxID=2719047 RepID=UPI001421B100|nr:ParA family protein [Oleiagrimonas sp. C23AA]NII10603.1 ParA family protein [Oleiagrimonas sp. C23AA]